MSHRRDWPMTPAYGVFTFTNYAAAFSFACRAEKPMRVVLGECDEDREVYYVCTPARAERLVAAGYQRAE